MQFINIPYKKLILYLTIIFIIFISLSLVNILFNNSNIKNKQTIILSDNENSNNITIPTNFSCNTDLEDMESVYVYEEVDNSSRFEKLRY